MSGGGGPTSASLVSGRYELEALLGRGGVGEVWRARHVTLRSHVAIKFLHGPSADDASTRERFLTEARVTAQLKTRHAVRVFDYGITDDGRPYLVMELLDGETLGNRLKRVHRLSPHLTASFLLQAARALTSAHSLRIVHRDFKPDNIVVVSEEEGLLESPALESRANQANQPRSLAESIKVLDFGIAKLVRDLSPAEPEPIALDSEQSISATLTHAGCIVGTPRYMAPEQILSAPGLDHRADVWALGVVAFECLTGQPPFAAKGLVELFANIQCGVHPRASALVPELPASFDAWFETACAIAPSNRFASAMTAALELATALGETPLDARDRVSEPPSSQPTAVRALAPATPLAPLTREATPTSRRRSDPVSSTASVATRSDGATTKGAFYDPPWDAPLDVQACIDAIPAAATMKGLFSIPLRAEATRRGITLSTARDRCLPFSDYPLTEHVRLLVDCAQGFWPALPLRMGLRKLGRQAYPAFLQSLIGKVLWAHVDHVGAGLEVAAKAYALSTPSARLTILESKARSARVRLDGVHYFLDSNHVGVFEGVLRACGAKGTVLVRLDAPSSGELLLRWE